ncbi:TadE/TadG family type IV pilus assembly protein [Brevundimonas sp. NPDC092305]|uniref:TadE/TadG family type IV pilus assembly protein n=1 Tax=Brevundimonas sp. NPDC092305 TaxID=3363957 RepID=UPI0038284C55
MTARFLGGFRSDDRGIAAVEFALLAPVMIMFYFGLTELCSGYMVQKRTGHVSSMMADLSTQQETVTKKDLGDILEVAEMVMSPFPRTTLEQRVTSIVISGGQARVAWSWSNGVGMAKLAPNTVVQIPPDLISAGQSIVMSETKYEYKSLVGKFLPKTNFSSTYYLRPRTSETTVCTDC